MNSPGKIGRLPRPLQKELNRRLLRGDSSTPILEWLNPLPEVQAIMQAEFAGALINKQNLSDWRATGLVKWETRQEILTEILDFDGDAAELDTATQGRLAERLATNLAGRYARLLHHWDGEVTDEFTKKTRGLRSLAQDVSHLRRWDHSAARVRLEQTRIEASQEPDNEALFMKFEEWALNIGVQEFLTAYYASERERDQARRKLLHLPPLPEDAAEPKSPAPGARLSQPQHAASSTPSDDQPPSARLSPVPNLDPCPAEILPRASSPAPHASTAPSTPSPEVNSTPKPLETLVNSSTTPPVSVNPCQPPAPPQPTRPGHSIEPPAEPDEFITSPPPRPATATPESPVKSPFPPLAKLLAIPAPSVIAGNVSSPPPKSTIGPAYHSKIVAKSCVQSGSVVLVATDQFYHETYRPKRQFTPPPLPAS